MTILAVTSGTAGCILGFAAKQAFNYHCLAGVRSELDKLVNKLASEHVGTFAGNFAAQEGSILASLPVSNLFGEVIALAGYELVMTVVHVASVVFFNVKLEEISLLRDMCLKTGRFATYFFTKVLFVSVCMPLVKIGVDFTLRHIAVLGIASLSIGALASPLAIIFSPPVTLLMGEIVGVILSEVAYSLLGRACKYYLD